MKKFFVGLLLCCALIFAAPFTACSDNQSDTPITPPTIEAPDEPFLDELFDVAGTAQTSDGLQYQKFISRSKKIKKAYITGYIGSNFNVRIPQTIDGYTVTEISGSAFKCTEINSVTLPDCVEKIDNQAFRNCRFLTSVDLGSVQAIGDSAFRNCPILTSVVLPKTCKYLGESVFSECVSLSTVNIPSKIKELPEFAFNYCESLENIVIPKTINKIGKSAFYYCTALKK